jgi:hypothetical protein
MKVYISILFVALVSFCSCRKFTWDNPNDTTNPSTEPVSLKNGLVAYYPFNGNANDESGNGNNGIVYSATLVADRFNKINKAYFLNGIDNYIRMQKPGPIGNPQVTVSFWLKSVNQKSDALIGWGDNAKTGNDFRIYQNGVCSSTIAFDTYDCAVNYLVGDILNSWHHFIVIYDGTIAPNVFSSSVYKDGIKISNTCFTQDLGQTNILGTNPITIGRYHGSLPSGYLEASIDDIRIYNRILNQQEITYLANN